MRSGGLPVGVRRRPWGAVSTTPRGGGGDPRLDLATARREYRHFAVVVQTPQSGAAMKPTCLLAVFVLAKVLVLWGRTIPISPRALPAYMWQDVLVVLLFAAVDFAFRRRPWIGW